MKRYNRLLKILSYAIITSIAIVNIFPAAWNFLTSIKTPMDSIAIPPLLIFKPTFDAYIGLFTSQTYGVDFPRFTLNSLRAAGTTTVITMIVSLMAGYSLARMSFRGKGIAGLLILATRMLPPVATILPLYLLANYLGLLDTSIALTMSYTALSIPLSVWLLRGYILDVPQEVEESALLDGCTRPKMLFRIVIPLILPGTLTVAFLTFLLAWNDFVIVSVLAFEKIKTLPMAALSFITDEGIAWPSMTATASILLIPPIIFVTVAQKYFIRGLGAGSIK